MGKRGSSFSNPLSRRGDNAATVPECFRTGSEFFRTQCRKFDALSKKGKFNTYSGWRTRAPRSARRHRWRLTYAISVLGKAHNRHRLVTGPLWSVDVPIVAPSGSIDCGGSLVQSLNAESVLASALGFHCSE